MLRPKTVQLAAIDAFPSETRIRTIPNIEGNMEFLNNHQAVIDHVQKINTLPAAFVRRVRHAFVRSNVVFSSDGYDLIPVKEQWRDQEKNSYTHDFVSTTNHMHAETKDNGFFVGSAGSSNYGHWLVDDLSRALAYLAAYSPPQIYITKSRSKIDPVKKDCLDILSGRDVRVTQLDHEHLYYFPELSFCDPVSLHPVMKSSCALNQVRDAALRTTRVGRIKRVFCNRSGTRVILNQDAVFSVLRDFGFHVSSTDTLDFRQQMELFAGADVVVGVMGAAMCNSIFCKTSTPLVYLCPAAWTEPFYWDLANTLDQYYNVLLCDSEGTGHNSDFTVDCDKLAAMLKHCLGDLLEKDENLGKYVFT